MVRGHRMRLIAVGLALTLLAVACGDDDGGSASETTNGNTSTTAGSDTDSNGEPEDFGGSLRVILSSQYNLPLIGADAAVSLGLFDEIGLDVELIESQDGVPALASGDADIAIASPNRFIGGILAGLDATIVGPTVDVWDQLWIVRSDVEGSSMRDFQGGKIGVSGFGSAGHYSAAKVADELGLVEGEDYEFVTMGNLDGLLAGLSNGAIDAFAWSAQAAFTLELQGDAKVLGHVSELIGPNPLDVIVVSNKTIAERPHAVRAFCEAYYDAQRQFKEDHELTIRTFIDEWDFDPEVTPLMVEAGAPYLSTTDVITDEMLDNMAEATVFTIQDVDDVTGSDVAEMYTPCSAL